YDPAAIRYDELLRIFFSVALDPTQVDRQGPDAGRQYRSALFPQDADQARVARAYIPCGGRLPHRERRRDRPRRGRVGHLRPGRDPLRRAPADLLLGGAGPDPGGSPGARCR
ncbi:hypothetical protein CTI14_55740, partial [Methylobacterium radiotolerans]